MNGHLIVLYRQIMLQYRLALFHQIEVRCVSAELKPKRFEFQTMFALPPGEAALCFYSVTVPAI